MKLILLDFLNSGNLFNQSFETISNPASSRPFSQVVKNLESTSADPVPPLRVYLAPEPTKSNFPGEEKGKELSLFRKRVHSAEFSLRKSICCFS